MKSVLILITLCLISFSCKKSDEGLVEKINISGSWKLKQYAGGFSYQVFVPKDSILYIFQTAGKYIFINNNYVTAKGSYTITKTPGGYADVLDLSEANGSRTSYEIILKNDSLILFDPCCDGYNYIYLKK